MYDYEKLDISKEMRIKLEKAIAPTNKRHETSRQMMIYEMKQYEKLATQLHWFKLGEDGVPELYLDNHMLQTFRMCEARFQEDFIHGYHGKSDHVWFLDFGSVLHTMIEEYYINRKDPAFNILKWAGNSAKNCWEVYNMDELYNEKSPWHHKDYLTLGGFVGFSALLLQYATIFHQENERFRVIGAELYFGKGKEVPLTNDFQHELSGFKMYLCGKIDLLMDDGSSIGPMDHKSTGHFKGKNPVANYELNDGLTGYVYAAKQLLTQHREVGGLDIDANLNKVRSVNKIWVNSIQVTPDKDPSNRFKRVPLYKTDFQLEEYRLRQVSTGARIFQLLMNPAMAYNYNTMVCNNWFHRTCSYQEVHRQNSRENQLTILNSSFNKGNIWNPEEKLGRTEE